MGGVGDEAEGEGNPPVPLPLLLIRRSPIPKRAPGARFFGCLFIGIWLHSAEWGQKICARSTCELIPTLSFKMLPLLLNVVHRYFSNSC